MKRKKSRLVPGKICFYFVQKFINQRLISRKLKRKIYRTVTLQIIPYGCEGVVLTDTRNAFVSK